MVAPVFVFDSNEKWFPVPVEESLSIHGFEWSTADSTWHKDGGRVDRLDFPKDMRPADLKPVVYHRVVADQHLWWQMYWCWFLSNPKTYLGQGAHEGDLECVMIGTTDKAGDRPVLVYGSQHHNGAGRVYWKCEQRDGRPVIYPARDSHAMYLGPVDNLEDQADGKGRVLDDYELREFGPWQDWPGRWGNSDNSPGPLATRRIWRQPAIVYGQAR